MPALLGAWTPQGVFAWFAAWNLFGFFATLLFVPETKALTLEELDQVFSVPTQTHAAYQLKAAGHGQPDFAACVRRVTHMQLNAYLDGWIA